MRLRRSSRSNSEFETALATDLLNLDETARKIALDEVEEAAA